MSDVSSLQPVRILNHFHTPEYDSLPRLPEPTKTSSGITRIFKKVIDLFVLPYIKLIGGLFPVGFIGASVLKAKPDSPLARQRLLETTEKIKSLARKMGIGYADRINVLVHESVLTSAGAVGNPFSPHIFIPPQLLVQPEDLPEHLRLNRLNHGQMSEEQWVQEFDKWLHRDFLKRLQPRPQTKFGVDARQIELKTWLKIFRNQQQYQKINDFIIGHELGHISCCHMAQKGIVGIAWKILSIASFGLLFLFKDTIDVALGRQHEKSADFFSARYTGEAKAGAEFFRLEQEARAELVAKYPEIAQEIADSSENGVHPPIAERIRYLEAFAS